MNPKIAAQIANTLNDPGLAKTLLATGAISGIAGGALTAAGKKDPNESRGSRRWRILRNALLSAGAGAGAVGLGVGGYRELTNALPKNDVDPARQILKGAPMRGLLGLTGIGVAHNVGGTIAQREADARTPLHAFLGAGSKSQMAEGAAERAMGGADQTLKRITSRREAPFREFRRRALSEGGMTPGQLTEAMIQGGINPTNTLKGEARVWMNRLFGPAYGKQIISPVMRTGLGLSAALAPEIVSGGINLFTPKDRSAQPAQ